jgi:NAD(P) transhydrogenase subunit beta
MPVLLSLCCASSMPQLVALLHSFVGVAAVLVGVCNAITAHEEVASETVHRMEIFIGICA